MEFCFENKDSAKPDVTSMVNEETETDATESVDTATDDEDDGCVSIEEQPQLNAKYPDASCSSPSVNIVTPDSSPRLSRHKPNNSMDVIHQYGQLAQ